MSVDHRPAFRRYQEIRGLSVNTIRRREVSLRQFSAHIHPVPLCEANADLVDEWLGLHGSAATRRAYRADLQAFFAWGARRDLCVNPILKTDPIRVPSTLPRPIPASLLPLILRAATPDVKLMVGLAAYAGLRVAEIAALDAVDIDLLGEPPTIAVRCGKGSKDRIVPAHPDLVRLLRAAKLRSGPVFGVSALTVGQRVSTHLRALGIEATTHRLRHSFGTELARTAGGNLVLLAKLMGHSDPATSMKYVGWSGGPGADAVGAMYPTAA